MSRKRKSFWSRHKVFTTMVIVVLVLFIAAVTWLVIGRMRSDRFQSSIQPFYNTVGLALKGRPGQLIRSEPLGVTVPGGRGVRILYRTQRANGSYTFSSGMVFIPNNNNGGTPRPVVAWAHGTIGQGPQCAPSRLPDPVASISWVSDMLQRGWVVTATDYAGLGTPGTEGYLVGGDEAHDVLNSVLAAQQVVGANAGNRFAVWGHSQGGNSALFTASEAASYTPKLQLVGTVASAPAAELPQLLTEQYGTALDWVIGPELLVSWAAAFPGLSAAAVTTSVGYSNYQRLNNECIASSTLEGLVRHSLGQNLFKVNPITIQAWKKVITSQSAPILKPNQPLMVAESLSDQVVLPNTTALYIQRACQADSNVTQLWLNGIGHIALQSDIAPQVILWIGDRFAGVPATSTCNQPLPTPPAT